MPLDIDSFTRPEDFKIRAACVEDIAAMAIVNNRANSANDLVKIDPETDYSEEDISRRLDKSHSWAFVAAGSDGLTGFVLGYPSAEEESIESVERTEYLALLMVDPTYWGRSIASRLLDKAAINASEQGRSQLVLWTGIDNERARSLYVYKGYRLTDATRVSQRFGPQVQYLLDI